MKTLLVCFFLSVNSAYAIDLSGAKIKGSGCAIQKKIENSNDVYSIPLNINLNKKSNSLLERKTCNLRVPVKIGANKKLQVFDAVQNIEIKSSKNTNLKANLKISVVGQKSKEIRIESESEEKKMLTASGLIVESDCGQDAMLTADLSVFATGPAEVSAKLDALSIVMKIVSCK